ncbi:MAG TPA: aminopeptidase P family protein, partial [Anaeromyxobacteraceae bacterium]|nr:aminopeptidase P family protein [Anaeromyxobacteraceae bacterium]
MDIPALQRALSEQKLDAWLLYDFHGQNPTAVNALGLAGHMLTRRWFYLVPAKGEPRVLVHAIELGSFPKEVPGVREAYASWTSLREKLGAMLGALPPKARVAMEYLPLAAIPYLSRVDAGTIELVRSLKEGIEITTSAELVQAFLCRWDDAQVASHQRALHGIDAAKDAAFERISAALKKGETLLETDVQQFLMDRFAEASLE